MGLLDSELLSGCLAIIGASPETLAYLRLACPTIRKLPGR